MISVKVTRGTSLQIPVQYRVIGRTYRQVRTVLLAHGLPLGTFYYPKLGGNWVIIKNEQLDRAVQLPEIYYGVAAEVSTPVQPEAVLSLAPAYTMLTVQGTGKVFASVPAPEPTPAPVPSSSPASESTVEPIPVVEPERVEEKTVVSDEPRFPIDSPRVIYIETPDVSGNFTGATRSRAIPVPYWSTATFRQLLPSVVPRYGPNGAFLVNDELVDQDAKLLDYGLDKEGYVVYLTRKQYLARS